MIIDGRALAKDVVAQIATAISSLSKPPVLVVFTCAPNFETQKFLALKERWAEEAGIKLNRIDLPKSVTLDEVASYVATATANSDGIIIQFPFPQLSTRELSLLIPKSHDVDVMYYDGLSTVLLPPVVGAIDVISRAHNVVWKDKQVVVVGNGRLVGAPAALYAAKQGSNVSVITKDTSDISSLNTADIIVLGAGVPGLLKLSMVKEGVLVFDAGTSEEGGMLVGDADPSVAEKASLFTPVPGGIGPLTVAILLQNVLDLAKNRRV